MQHFFERLPTQTLQHPDLNAREICGALPERGIGRLGPDGPHLERSELECAFCAQLIFSDQALDTGEERLVVEHEDLRIEDFRLLRTSALFGTFAKRLELRAHIRQGISQPRNLGVDMIGRDNAIGDLR